MDSYDLFGEDGAGMLEGLPDLGGDHFDPAVTGAPRGDAAPTYAQPTYTQENPLQKLASFGGTDFTHMDPNAQNMYAQGYGTERPMGPPGGPYPHQRQIARPPGPQTAATGQYPYQPDNMYSMPDHQISMGDAAGMQGWGQHSGYPIHRYGQMGSYRQQPMAAYGHQQEQKHQFPPTQHPIMQQPHQTAYPMQQRHTPHYPQGTAYPAAAAAAAASQAYGAYGMHQRMPHHHQYPQTHHQIDMGVSQAQQYNHMGHGQTLSSHAAPHTGPAPGHMSQSHPPSQGHGPPTQQPPSQNHLTHPSSMGYTQTPHQPMQPIQRPMEVAPPSQQYPSKHTAGPGPGVLGSGSPQYRAPFPQLSPQMSSPRPQMSPRPPAPQMSPRPVMSPAKPNVSPHPQMQQTTLSPRPATSLTPKSTTASPAPMPAYSQQSTLQALEQMVMPPSSTNNTEYPTYQSRNSLGPPQTSQNPLSPATMGLRNPMSDQWPPQQQQQQPRPQHIPSMNGNMSMLDQSQMPPASQNIPPPSQNLPPTPNIQIPNLQNNQNLETSFGNEELRGDISKPISISEVSTPVSQDSTSSHSLPPVITQSDFSSVRSPTSGNMPDKPSSTTNNTEVSTPTSIHDVPISHPATPTPSSTTDDNAASNQESSLPANTESLKSIEDNSNSNSAIQQPSQSQNNTTNFTDFTSVSSMTNYTKNNSQPPKTNMDDLMPLNVPLYSQESSLTSLSHESATLATTVAPVVSTTTSQQSQLTNVTSATQLPPAPHNINLQQSLPSQQNQTSQMPIQMNQIPQPNQIPSTINSQQVPSGTVPSSTLLPNLQSNSNLQIPQVHQTPPPPSMPPAQPPPIPTNQSNLQTGQTNIINQQVIPPPPVSSSIPPPNAANLQPLQPVPPSQHIPVPSPQHGAVPPQPPLGSVPPPQPQHVLVPQQPVPQSTNMPLHSQNSNQINHPNMPPNIPPHSQATPGMYEQNPAMLGPNGMPIGGPRPIPHNMPPIGMPGMPPMGMGAPPAMVPGMTPTSHQVPAMMPNQEMGSYQPPVSHHQERAALQQQLQELYCMPPAPEHQEKIAHLQERLNILAQHEANDQCNGGSQCVLQTPIFTSPMIDSPQVSSTTGRGRGKGAPRAKKPRQKKGEKDSAAAAIQISQPVVTPPINVPPQPLPVSEDCVTPGAGLNIPSGEMTDIGADVISGDVDSEKQKKPRGARKPREPKKPKEPKPPKAQKERKKREPKEPKEQRVKRKYVRKKKPEGEESITDDSFNKSAESGDDHADISQTSQSLIDEFNVVESGDAIPESTKEAEQVQADSQTPAEGGLESVEIESGEGETKKDEYAFEEQSNSNEEIEKMVRKPKRSKPPAAPKKVVSSKARSSRSSGSSRSRKRKGMLTESDGEGEDLIATPPPSPPEDAENATQKRRSARNTQRKKYIDDVMLRFSDDESPQVATKSKKAAVPAAPVIVAAAPPASTAENSDEQSASGETGNKPNFVYVNTTDEDAMVVQYVLASRMSKREKRVELNKEEPKAEGVEDENKEKSEESSQNIDNKTDEVKSEVEKSEDSDAKEAASTTKPEEVTDENKSFETIVVDVEEYYVKYRNFSYLHCEWKTEEELYKGDKRIANKIKRFKQKMQQQLNIFEYLDDEPFNPDYVEVDRVLDVAEHTDPNTQETIKHYLVKWRSLQYEDSTWELEEDVDPLKIEQFVKFKTLPSKDKWKPKRRPHPDLWSKLEQSPAYKGNNILREYQLEGLNWLLFSWHNSRNCILADEMGLGKTIQSLTFLHAIHEFGIRGPFLIIAPLSTIPNWQREIEAWTELNVIVYHGSSASRNMIQEYEYYFKNDKGQPNKDLTKFNILITTFEIIVTDFADLKGFNWRVCIIDEAHRLKNRNCKLLEGLRQLTLEHRVLLSGTPLQNNVNELFSLLNFLEPTQFPNSDVFLQEFGLLKTEQEVQKLQCILKPMMLRRLKEDVEKSLAPKEETVVEVELTNIQKKYYRGILERNFSFLQKGTTQANIPNLMNTMMELRKCCIHPYLLNGAEDQIQYDFKMQHGEDADAYYKALIHSSGKMVLIDKLLPKLRANGHRVLLFSQMVRCLDILEDYLMYKKYPFERIDGRIRGNLRQAAIDRFSRPDSDRFVFLLCTKAGGLGINLTAADTVIIYDSDWNPQNDLQAQARCHRIGQQKMVKIYRLLCRNTYEREMFDKASLKLGLDKAVLQSMNTSQGGKDSGNRQLSKKEIEDLLKKGAYGALLDEENDGDKFCEEDIDMILARRTQVITMESEKGSTFSKASFASSANRSDINIDDPDFWNKWAKRADIDTTEKDETEDLVLSEPRRRTQIKRYGHDESAIDMSDLESSSDSDGENDGLSLGMRSRRSKKLKKKLRSDDYLPRDGERGDIVYGSWARRECFMVERGLLTFGWGRWREILDHSQLRKGWKESDIEDCARVILLYCLRFYRGDEKIRSFIWDLITPCENGEGNKITRNHHGLKDPVPRGIRNKNKKKGKDSRHAALTDPNHWSKNEKYDGDIFLENNYKKHLGRHANKVLLRVRMLYYIKHEIIGDLVQHIADGVHASALPINPPITEQLPCEWWDTECDKSLLVGTWKHGYENYAEMRADPTLCFLSRCGPPSARELQLASNTQPPTPALNEDDMDDEDTNEEFSIKSNRLRDLSEVNSEIAEPSPGPSASSETQPSGDPDEQGFDELGDKQAWPSATDLNTRLRRVITSYQRSYRKEEQQKLAKAKPASVESALSSPLAALAQVSQQLDARDAASLAMPGWDLQQLALYLLKMERQGKQLEQAARERERQSIARKWTRREEADFFRVVSSYGVNYYRKKKAYDWIKFKQLAKLEKKTDEEMTEYYKSFVVMCKRQTGVKIDEESYDSTIEHISEEKARRTLERLELLSRIREEIVTHPKLEERLKVCLTSADMPDWWIPGKHDKDLLLGVAKHGLGRTDYYILNDPELCFQEILRKKVSSTTSESSESKDAIKLESHEDILKFDRNEILVKLEKGEGTLKIEKVSVIKKDILEDKEKEKKKEENTKIELTLVKNEAEEQESIENKPNETKVKTDNEDKKEEVHEDVTTTENKELTETSQTEKEIDKTQDESHLVTEEDKEQANKKDSDSTEDLDNKPKKEEGKVDEKDGKPLEKFAKKDIDEETDLCAKQAAELKAMFPDLEVIQPLSRLSQVDTFVLRDKQGTGALDFSETTVAQLFNNAVKWPREYAIQVRLQHIVYAIETKEWPTQKTFSAYANGIGSEFDIPIHEIPNDPPKRETSTPMSMGDSEVITITTDNLHRGSINKKRKRHIAIDVETERAKLHALLNSSHSGLPNPLPKPGTSWGDNEDSEDSRRSTPVTQPLQPPPAHQQQTSRLLNMQYDLKYHAPKTIGQTSVIPGTSSTLTPIDLSSGLPKMNTPDIPKVASHDIQNEVQDFSLKKQSCPTPTSIASAAVSSKPSGNKLDDTLSKLMKRKNCPVEEPVVGKEKKRRKLDEIVLGLSAAKEQMLFPETTTKKTTVTPSVTVTPTLAPVTSAHHQKPFTITVTSIPSPAPPPRSCATPNLKSMPTKDNFSNFLAQAEQQTLLLKKQQQQQKSYEAMIADINKVADFSSKVNSYSHEAKVNKWLAEQNAALAEQPLGTDYLAPRRRRPRVDPSLLDWKKLTGNENVSVIHRVTNKKLTGPKAPTLKRLGQWLMENPMYDIDPKWAELVKERGNLSHDLQKRFGANGNSSNSSLKKGTPGRPPLLSSPTGSTSSVSSANLATSLASTLPFPSLAGSGLTGLNSSLLSGLSGLGQFDSKNMFDPKNPLFDPKNPLFDPKNNPLFDPKNPLLMPFAAGMPNISALNSMAGLGNLGNMNLFANLAGLGLPGLGMDPSALTAETTSTPKSKASTGGSNSTSTSESKSKQQKPTEAHSSSKPSVSTASASLPTSTPFPFFFPNPSLLYTPLGLGGLNPFALQPGMSAAYDTLAQQCNLLNGNLNPGASPNSSSKSSKANTRVPSVTSTATAVSQSKSPRPSRDHSHLQNLILPPDTQLLESISKVAGTLDASMKHKGERRDNKHKTLDSLRGMLPTDFSSPEKLRSMKDLSTFADFNKLLEATQSSSGPSNKTRDHEMKEAIEKISKSNAELLARAMTEDPHRPTPSGSNKRQRESIPSVSENSENVNKDEENPPKRIKEAVDHFPLQQPSMAPPVTIASGDVDIEALLPPSTVVKSSSIPSEEEKPPPAENPPIEAENPEPATTVVSPAPAKPSPQSSNNIPEEQPALPPPPPTAPAPTQAEPADSTETAPKKNTKRRGKRRSGEIPLDPETVIERKNLRSSASRSAAVAAARAAAEQAAAKQLEAENAQKNLEGDSA